jgi:hypothetical protein
MKLRHLLAIFALTGAAQIHLSVSAAGELYEIEALSSPVKESEFVQASAPDLGGRAAEASRAFEAGDLQRGFQLLREASAGARHPERRAAELLAFEAARLRDVSRSEHAGAVAELAAERFVASSAGGSLRERAAGLRQAAEIWEWMIGEPVRAAQLYAAALQADSQDDRSEAGLRRMEALLEVDRVRAARGLRALDGKEELP